MKYSNKPVKYRDVKSLILKYICENELPVDSILPSEREWSDKTGASRLTVRRAIGELAQEGYVYGVHGKGTFVKHSKINNNLFALTSCTQDIIDQGRKASTKVLLSTVNTASSELASKLKIGVGSSIFSLKRLYFADDHPLNLTHTHIVRDYVPGIEDYDYEKVSLYDVIEKKKEIPLKHAERFIKACSAPPDVASLMEVEPGFPLLYFVGIVYANIGDFEKPIECFSSYYRTDEFGFYINQIRRS